MKPFIVGCIKSINDWNNVNNINCDVVELRYDYFQPSQKVILNCEKPIILTYRHISEGGISNENIEYRVSIMIQLLSIIDIIDIDLILIEKPCVQELIKIAHILNKEIIISHHWFTSFPTLENIKAIIKNIKNYNINYLKIAFPTEKEEDINLGLDILKNTNFPLIVMGMGKYGKQSRYEFAKNGSKAIYGYVGNESIVAGQPSIDEINQNI